MQTKYLQRLMRHNAAFITNLHEYIVESLALAKYLKAIKEISFAVAEYKEVGRARAELAKAVETQKALKAELEQQHNILRIQALIGKLKDSHPVEAFDVLMNATATTGEKVKALRAML